MADKLRTFKAFEGVNETPFTEGLLGDNQTITGQEFSDNPIIGGMQKFNKGLLGTVLKTGEQGLNYAMGTAMLPFALAGDTAEGIHEALPDTWANKLSDIMYNSGGSMDSDDFGDAFEGHLLEGIMAFPTFAEFRPIALKYQQKGQRLPKEVIEQVLEKIQSKPNPNSQKVFLSYNEKIGNPKTFNTEKVFPEESYLQNIAEFYQKAKHTPNHPKIKASYEALKNETLAQYQHMIENGIVPEIYYASKGKPEPYISSAHMMEDVANNNKLKFLKTNIDDLPPDHPMAQPSGIIINGEELLVNDIFRVVHDYYGHTGQGYQFGSVGEYNAYLSHANMYSDASIPALANETLFQNAWVNYNKGLQRSDGSYPKIGDPDFVPQSERPFAQQKTILFDNNLLKQDKNFVNASIVDDVTGIDKKVATGQEYKDINKKFEPTNLLESQRKNELMTTTNIHDRLNKRMEYDFEDMKKIDSDYKPNTITLDPEGRVINARFVSGKKDALANDVYSSAKLNELDDIGLTEFEIKRLAMILADDYGSGYKYFQKNPTHRGFVDAMVSEDSAGNMLGINQTLGLNNQVVKFKDGKPKVQALTKDEIVDVLQHETGHLIGNLTSYKSVYAKYLKDNPKSNITNEMVSMSKKLRPENWKNKDQLSYLNSPEELMADSIKMYLVNPSKAKEMAPEFVKFLRKMINDSKIKNIINLSKAPENMIDDGLLSKYA